ncbi:hypothetical protein EJ08DRAFT_378008 [Tothia fuscella]|uniref:Uncharacterized protein n=1 Tax=Tothia fuscella TaxID=1048955 RepID=A0A9P4NLC7_9PEZI|nr:hypothetical protein EJ08DRAFT_378008 [Tothia fuscella]
MLSSKYPSPSMNTSQNPQQSTTQPEEETMFRKISQTQVPTRCSRSDILDFGPFLRHKTTQLTQEAALKTAEANNQTSPLLRLPNELLLDIQDACSGSSAALLRQTSRRLRCELGPSPEIHEADEQLDYLLMVTFLEACHNERQSSCCSPRAARVLCSSCKEYHDRSWFMPTELARAPQERVCSSAHSRGNTYTYWLFLQVEMEMATKPWEYWKSSLPVPIPCPNHEIVDSRAQHKEKTGWYDYYHPKTDDNIYVYFTRRITIASMPLLRVPVAFKDRPHYLEDVKECLCPHIPSTTLTWAAVCKYLNFNKGDLAANDEHYLILDLTCPEKGCSMRVFFWRKLRVKVEGLTGRFSLYDFGLQIETLVPRIEGDRVLDRSTWIKKTRWFEEVDDTTGEICRLEWNGGTTGVEEGDEVSDGTLRRLNWIEGSAMNLMCSVFVVALFFNCHKL